jgi:hypothetical protein
MGYLTKGSTASLGAPRAAAAAAVTAAGSLHSRACSHTPRPGACPLLRRRWPGGGSCAVGLHLRLPAGLQEAATVPPCHPHFPRWARRLAGRQLLG